MDLLDRAIFMLIGITIGFIAGYIVRSLRDIEKEVHEVLEIEKHHRDDERGVARPSFSTFALLLVVLLTAYAAFVSQATSNELEAETREDQISRCQAGVDSRNVQRAIVEAIYDLATGAAQRNKNMPERTEAERQQYNDYIRRVNKFRNETYEKIQPSEECRPLVPDDDVEPPTEDFPTIPPVTKETR